MILEPPTAGSWERRGSGRLYPHTYKRFATTIGVRWASSDGDLRAARYISGRFEAYGLNNVDLEPFPLKTWRCDSVAITVAGEESWDIDARPTLFCPATSVTGPLVDAGYGMPHEIERLGGSPQGANSRDGHRFRAIFAAPTVHDSFNRPRCRGRACRHNSESSRRPPH